MFWLTESHPTAFKYFPPFVLKIDFLAVFALFTFETCRFNVKQVVEDLF